MYIPEVSFAVQEEVFWFEVAVDDVLRVEVWIRDRRPGRGGEPKNKSEAILPSFLFRLSPSSARWRARRSCTQAK